MDTCFFPKGDMPAQYPYFPSTASLVVWRNWFLVPAQHIAAALDCSVSDVTQVAVRMGLAAQPQVSPLWKKRGYLTVIRNNWNLCEYDQICTLLDISLDELEFILREEDFMWDKMGSMKPSVVRPVLHLPLSNEDAKRLDEIGSFVRRHPVLPENAFDFLEGYFQAPSKPVAQPQRDSIRMIHSYFSLYGDTLVNDAIDSYPDALLAAYASAGINAVWLQGLLSMLAPNPWNENESIAAVRAQKLEALRKLVARAGQYGIGVYLYLNEPRPEKEGFFQDNPELAGTTYGDFRCLCPSVPQVLQYLEDSMAYLFEQVPDLAGFFSITNSENFTNCACRGAEIQETCPRCANRPTAEIMAQLNNAMARGAHRSSPDAKALIYTWVWDKAWDTEAISLLTENQYILSVSEEKMPYCIGGISGEVIDYSMTQPGPSQVSLRRWTAARKANLHPMAKIQINGSWELSAVPYLPVFSLIGQHLQQLKSCNIRDILYTWTVGGAPSPVAQFASTFIDSQECLDTFLPRYLQGFYGDAAATVLQADKVFCEAFKEFPFAMDTLYFAPQTFGPMAPFFHRDTHCKASMVGFPYDDLSTWRGAYPEDVFAQQFAALTAKWKLGLEIISAVDGNDAFAEYRCMAQAAYCHFASTYNHICFVRCRNDNDTAGMKQAIEAEQCAVQQLATLRAQDSRIGFEASNQYYYSMADLAEKQINLQYILDAL